MAGWFEREPTLEEIENTVELTARQMQRMLDLGQFLEEETVVVEIDWKVNPVPVKRSLIEKLYNVGVQVEVDVFPVRERFVTELLVVCEGTRAPNPGLLVEA